MNVYAGNVSRVGTGRAAALSSTGEPSGVDEGADLDDGPSHTPSWASDGPSHTPSGGEREERAPEEPRLRDGRAQRGKVELPELLRVLEPHKVKDARLLCHAPLRLCSGGAAEARHALVVGGPVDDHRPAREPARQ